MTNEQQLEKRLAESMRRSGGFQDQLREAQDFARAQQHQITELQKCNDAQAETYTAQAHRISKLQRRVDDLQAMYDHSQTHIKRLEEKLTPEAQAEKVLLCPEKSIS